MQELLEYRPITFFSHSLAGDLSCDRLSRSIAISDPRPQSRENAISATGLAAVLRRIPCVARIVSHKRYSIISHRTPPSLSRRNRVFSYDFRQDSFADRRTVPLVSRHTYERIILFIVSSLTFRGLLVDCRSVCDTK